MQTRNGMSGSDPRFDESDREGRLQPAPEELTLNGHELETLLALAENRSLEPEQVEVAARLRRDPRTRRALERQRRIAGALRGGGPAAPPTLAPKLAEKTARLSRPRRRGSTQAAWSVKLIAATVAVLAVVGVVASVIMGSSGGTTRPTAAQIAAVWTLPAGGRRVSTDPDHPTQLDISYHGIVFPNFHDREGWHPAGARYDRIRGLMTATVFYQTGRRRAAYTIVPAAGLPVPAHASHLRVAGLALREFRNGDRWIVTFERNGNTCVLTAAAPRERRWLIALATWRGGPPVKQATPSRNE
jgi:hypothetical protein